MNLKVVGERFSGHLGTDQAEPLIHKCVGEKTLTEMHEEYIPNIKPNPSISSSSEK